MKSYIYENITELSCPVGKFSVSCEDKKIPFSIRKNKYDIPYYDITTETNYALRHANDNSLLIFDEIGRGTATFDGMALAEAILEYIASKIGAKTMFSTHYHEITKIQEQIPCLKNVRVGVSHTGDKITFLYRVEDGAMGKSYGIHVASLAKLPDELLRRAEQILVELEKEEVKIQSEVLKEEVVSMPSWVKDIEKIDPLNMSPLDALNFLYDLKRKMKE